MLEHMTKFKDVRYEIGMLWCEPKQKNLCDGFKETSRNLEVFFIKVSKNERRSYLTNFFAVSISNGHKIKLNSNFVLALSLSY